MCHLTKILRLASYPTVEESGRGLHCYEISNQKDYEVIVIDDCSTDNTLRVMDKFLEDVILIKQKENKGLPNALNTGIKKAKGRFIIRLDSDDYVHYEYLNILSLFRKTIQNK